MGRGAGCGQSEGEWGGGQRQAGWVRVVVLVGRGPGEVGGWPREAESLAERAGGAEAGGRGGWRGGSSAAQPALCGSERQRRTGGG